ncbi:MULTISPECIES: glycoside-pentoside-hexuronide (GPH):cation symporter [unclassified Gilliamella]|uniref:glycoside-pentoside-hexuronide (GPH):cation symporter n=1 Tax=unclassified Gilliamella TaxID=2685620 RepID=UPI000A34F6BB|nr:MULTISPECIES: glycoside-pentoside-hexuronide (GPH):cation symporter [unclassified Gilliamella]
MPKNIAVSQGHDSSLTPVKTNVRQRIFYGLGDTGYNFLFDMGQLYLLKYFTDHLGLPSVWAGSVFLVAKVWDAFADISVGTWIDNRMNIGPKGKFRPFIFYSAIPLALLLVATFSIPNFSLTWKIILAYLSYMIFGTVYSIGNIAYGSIVPAMTKNSQERTILASFRQAGGTLGLLIATVAFMPIVWLFDNESTGYLAAVTIFGIAGASLVMLSAKNVEEHYVIKPKEKLSKAVLKKSYGALLKNRPLLILCVVNVFTFSAYNVKLAIQIFFAQYTLHDTSIIPYMGFFSIGSVFIGTIIVPNLVKYIDKVWLYIIGCVIWAAADLTAFFVVDSPFAFVAFASLAFLGSSFINTLNWALISDAVEYGEWKTGIRAEGLVYSSYTFFRKLSQAIAGFVPGIVLAFVGYVPNAEQSENALFGIRSLIYIYPGALAILTIVFMYFFYPLWNDKYKQIIGELSKRNAEK